MKKTENGVEFPSEAYAYVPKPDEPSTWKLRLWETPALKVTARQVGMAVAALGAGFRGNKVEIPSGDRTAVIAKVRAAWNSVHAKTDEMPAVIKEHADSAPTRAELMAKCEKDHPTWTAAQCKTWVDKMLAEDAKDKGADESKEMAQHENTIKGIEIFATGTHNGDPYDEADLDAMVSAFGSLDFKPALKIGHTKDVVGAPAFGFVENLRRVGSKLIADFSSMHDSVVNAIRDKRYDRVSSEVYFNLKRNGSVFKRALKAVALLGAEVPAVANLVPLHKMEFAAEGEYEMVFSDEGAELNVSPQAMFDCLTERMAAAIQLFNSEEIMTKAQKEQLKALEEKLAIATEKLNSIGDGTDAEKLATVKTLSAEVKDIGAQIKQLTQAAGEDSDSEQTKKDLKAATDRIAELEADGRRRSVAEKVGKLRVPAFRPAMEAMYGYALTHNAEKVKVYAKDKDGKETAAEKTLIEITDEVVSNINAQAEKLFKAFAHTGDPIREDGEQSEDAGQDVDKRTKDYMGKNPTVKDYMVAMQAVLAADPELARRYTEQTAPRTN